MNAPLNPLALIAAQITTQGASVTLGLSLTSDEERELITAAQAYIDQNGDDDDDLAYLIQKAEADAEAWESYLDAETDCDFEDWLTGKTDAPSFGWQHPDSPSFGRAWG